MVLAYLFNIVVIYTQTLNMINDVEMLKIYATPCGYDPIILTYS